MLYIPLLLPDYKKTTNLKELWDISFKVESINLENIYNGCKNIVPHRKILKICKTPENLIFSFQRFDFDNNIKNEIEIIYLGMLDIREYTDEKSEEQGKFIYNLYALVTHDGDLEFGHYKSFIKFNRFNELYEFNDSIVNEYSSGNSLFKNAYILFYIKS